MAGPLHCSAALTQACQALSWSANDSSVVNYAVLTVVPCNSRRGCSRFILQLCAHTRGKQQSLPELLRSQYKPSLRSCAVAGVAVKPSCVNRAAIRALNKHIQPRVIHVVSGTLQQCTVFQACRRQNLRRVLSSCAHPSSCPEYHAFLWQHRHFLDSLHDRHGVITRYEATFRPICPDEAVLRRASHVAQILLLRHPLP